jgi:hypothetical protein
LYYNLHRPAAAIHVVRSRPERFPAEAKSEHLAFFALIHEWEQCELILSAFAGDKNIPALRDMMEAVFNNFSIPMMQKALAVLYYRIAVAALSGVARRYLSGRLQADPEKWSGFNAAKAAVLSGQPEHPDIKNFVQHGIFAVYGIKLKPYSRH